MARTALVVFLLGLGVIVYEFATLTTILSNNPWLKALPALVPFIALVATIFLAVAKDEWLTELAKSVIVSMQRIPLVLYIGTLLVIVISVGFGRYVWQLAGAKEGEFTVQVVRKHDVPDQAVPGLPVVLEHKLRADVLERITDNRGKATFDVDLSDVFAVRIRKSAAEQAPVFVLASDAHVSDKTKKGFRLVKLAGIPEKSWISGSDTLEDFVRLPAPYFRWRAHGRGQNVIRVHEAQSTFPFTLPGAETVIIRRAFSIGFSPLLRLPRWVAYRIVRGPPVRRVRAPFKADPELPPSYQASSSDYRRNDFDRGTLVRSSDMFGLGEDATLEAYYLSTVVPQLSYVNQRTWLALEEYTSEKATPDRDVYVIRGPIYEPSDDRTMVNVTLMGAGLVPVPTHFFQILFISAQGGNEVEAHIVPNTYVPFDGKNVARFRSTVQSIAEKTGLQFDEKLSIGEPHR